MKNRYLLALIGLCFTVSLAAQLGTWTGKGSRITARNRSIQGVAAIDTNTVWAITYHLPFSEPAREFTRTTDGGKTWKTGVIDAALGREFTSISLFALDSSTAWVAMTNLPFQNQSRIYKTTNGGGTWAQQFGSFNQPDNSADFIHFFNENEGITFGAALGSDTDYLDTIKIWTTIDGGTTWNRIPQANLPASRPREGFYYYYSNGPLDAKGDTIWLATNLGRIWKSTDKGQNWQVYEVAPGAYFEDLASIAFQDAFRGMLILASQAFRTSDGGITWEKLSSFPNNLPYYEIEAVPGLEDTYFAGSAIDSGSPLEHSFTVDNGDHWFTVNGQKVEVFDFLSPNHAWGGGTISNPILGGMYLWKGNFLLDYYAEVDLLNRLNYSVITPRQFAALGSDFGWDLVYKNAGQLPFNTQTNVRILKGVSSLEQFQILEQVPAKDGINVPIDFSPADFGEYECLVTGKSIDSSYNFSYTASKSLSLDESILAKDDGNGNSGLGFGFGDPSWYGYYGSAFDLAAADTLTAITIYIENGSNYRGSINLTVTEFDETGIPSQELLHTEQLNLLDYRISTSNPALTYQLPEPLVLLPGKYMFAAGQDTLQGIIGFEFDTDNIQQDGFWLVSPVAGGGYPWAHLTNREVLMIRPHFTPSAVTTTSTKDIAASSNNFKVYPNPTDGAVTIELDEIWKHASFEILIYDVLGKQVEAQIINPTNHKVNVVRLELNLASGIYFLTLKQGDYVQTTKLIIE